ncbi:MAG: hypothetical protein IKY52_09635 [Clostridia bacterium]|nr:hypothetical protein [Clostridia bacterium]
MTEIFPPSKTKKFPVLAAVSAAIPTPALADLQTFCETVVLLPPDPLLPAPVASHADMLLFAIDDALVVHRSYYAIAQQEIDRILVFTGFRLVLTDCPRGNRYPMDIALNALLCGSFLFGRLDALAPEILSIADQTGITPVHIRQGYAGCSGIALGNAVATADPSLTRAASACGIDVIPVPDRKILLPGYDHGFFGGCAGVWGNTVFLCGVPDPAEYSVFLHQAEIRCFSVYTLSSIPLYDCGGIRLFSKS